MIFCERFAHNPVLINLPAGQTLFREGEEGHLMYMLSIGSADLIVTNRVVETRQHGSVVGEMGIVSPGPRSASVVANWLRSTKRAFNF